MSYFNGGFAAWKAALLLPDKKKRVVTHPLGIQERNLLSIAIRMQFDFKPRANVLFVKAATEEC